MLATNEYQTVILYLYNELYIRQRSIFTSNSSKATKHQK